MSAEREKSSLIMVAKVECFHLRVEEAYQRLKEFVWQKGGAWLSDSWDTKRDTEVFTVVMSLPKVSAEELKTLLPKETIAVLVSEDPELESVGFSLSSSLER